MEDLAKKLICYFETLGIEVYTNTKARGHQGFFLKNRIDISKNTKQKRVIPTLMHEFAHFIHSKLEPEMAEGGTIEVLFNIEQKTERLEKKKKEQKKESSKYVILSLFQNPNSELPPCNLTPSIDSDYCERVQMLEKELLSVTNFVDEHSLCHKLITHKEQIKRKIKVLEGQIKEDYPHFMRTKKFKEFNKYIKKSKARYLLKYDRVKFIVPKFAFFSTKEEIFSIDSIEIDFPDMPRAFCSYIRLKSFQKKQAKNSKRINHLNKYYSKPAELFARLVEGLYINPEKTRELAPLTCQIFFELLEAGYYFELKNVFNMLQEQKTALVCNYSGQNKKL